MDRDPAVDEQAGRIAQGLLDDLYHLYSGFAPELSDEDVRDIAVEIHRRVMAELMGNLAEMRDRWERIGAWWDIEDEETEDEA